MALGFSMKSAFFERLRSSWYAWLDEFLGQHAIVSAVYMLFVLPLFMLLALLVVLGSVPGLVLHSLIWRRLPLGNERSRLTHDATLVLCGAGSAALTFVYVFPLFSGIGGQPCSLGPVYC
jgi:hypothetical protein